MAKYNSVTEMSRSLTDEKFSKKVAEDIEQKKVAKLLFTLRCNAKLSQKEMADKIGCSQARISKLEKCDNDNIRIGDLKDYANALNLELNIGYSPQGRTAVDSIKYHAFKIREKVNYLESLAQKDQQISDGVANFFGEALNNIVNMFLKSCAKLKRIQKKPKEIIHISHELEAPELDHNTKAFQSD